MANEPVPVEVIDRAFAEFTHPQPGEKLLFESVIALQNAVADLLLSKRKADGHAADSLLTMRLALRAKYKLLGYDADDSIRFTP